MNGIMYCSMFSKKNKIRKLSSRTCSYGGVGDTKAHVIIIRRFCFWSILNSFLLSGEPQQQVSAPIAFQEVCFAKESSSSIIPSGHLGIAQARFWLYRQVGTGPTLVYSVTESFLTIQRQHGLQIFQSHEDVLRQFSRSKLFYKNPCMEINPTQHKSKTGKHSSILSCFISVVQFPSMNLMLWLQTSFSFLR